MARKNRSNHGNKRGSKNMVLLSTPPTRGPGIHGYAKSDPCPCGCGRTLKQCQEIQARAAGTQETVGKIIAKLEAKRR